MTGQTIKTQIDGNPCLIRVTHFDFKPPFNGPSRICHSDVDYLGYYECDFEVLDNELEALIDQADRDRIEKEILDAYLKTDWRA